MSSNLKVGDKVVVIGSDSWITEDGPVTIVGFGRKNGQVTVSFSNGQWAYISEVRKA